MGKELLEESVVAIDAVVASSNDGGVQGGSLPEWRNYVTDREPCEKRDENVQERK